MIKKKTFDILDTYFTDKVSNISSLQDDLRWDTTKVEFHLDPKYWNEFYQKLNSYKFDWHTYKFDNFNELSKLPDKGFGVYVFIVKALDLIFELPQFVMYVGISNENGSKRAIKDRLTDYYRLDAITKRKKVHRLLERYYHNTFVCYTILDDNMTHDEVAKIEENLHGFFIPPANDRDFPIEIKAVVKAQFTK